MIGGGTENESKPTVAALTNRYLIGKGIPQSAIVSENVSLSTLQQLLLLQNIAEKMNPIIVAIISSEWHLPRITAMLERHPQLTHLNVRAPILLAAEEILLQDAADQWQNAIEKSRQNPETLARIAREKLGLSQIFDGTYRYR